MTRRRLDSELLRRGLVASRAHAQDAIDAGLVLVQGAVATKAATLVGDDAAIVLAGEARRFVSRGGEKLAAALLRFSIDPSDRLCLDAGSSTGGFTDCLLRAGARHVVAVDVGYGQLAWSLRNDPRVSVLERTDIRQLAPQRLPYLPELIVADLSFISLRTVVPSLAAIAAERCEAVFLVKPQFEAGPQLVGRGGVVRDRGVWAQVVRSVIDAASAAGFSPAAAMASPVRGRAGNVEFLLWARTQGPPATIDVDAVAAEGEAVAA